MTFESRARRLAVAHRLPAPAAEQLLRLVAALAAEPDPPTAIRAPDEVVDRHLADSLTALDLSAVRGAHRLADVGSGAGFPGLPLAIALPAARVDLLEAAGRKCEVIERLAVAADVANARPIAARAEEWAAGEGRSAYEIVTARAVASLAVLAEYAAPLLGIDGVLVAWKGRRAPDEERAGVAAAERLGLQYSAVVPVTPFAAARERHLHVLVKRQPTPTGFPRRPGRAARRPLA